MIRRDLIIRFRQTFFGVAWLLFKPLMMMFVVSLAFGLISRFEQTTTAPYPLVVLCGVIPWYFFSSSIPEATQSLVIHLQIIRKTYFPRLIVPLVAIAVSTIEFLIAWLLFIVACFWYGVRPGLTLVAFPVFVIELIVLCAGLGLWLSLLHARFRDVGNAVPFLISIGFFVTPIGYVLSAVPDRWRALLIFNPLVGIVEGFRWSLLGGSYRLAPDATIACAVESLSVLGCGLWYFRATETSMVDIA